MSPEKAKVFVVDDSKECQNSLKRFLETEGHQIIATAESLKQALEIIEVLEQVDVALVDGNLSELSRGGFDGARVAAAFRQKFPGVPLFSISADSQPWSDDPELTKRDGSWVIAERVTKA